MSPTLLTIIHLLRHTAHAFLIVAFLCVSAYPAHALAFVESTEAADAPFFFTQDPTLADSALVGIEAFPEYTMHSSRAVAVGETIRVLASAYSSTVGQTDGDPFTTASGSHVHQGTLAANFLPFGTQVRINNQTYTVEDRLHARYNHTYIVDIWFPNRESAIHFGVRTVAMEVVAIP